MLMITKIRGKQLINLDQLLNLRESNIKLLKRRIGAIVEVEAKEEASWWKRMDSWVLPMLVFQIITFNKIIQLL